MLWIAPAPPAPMESPVQGILSGDDYPAAALDRNEEGSVAAELLIDPAGKVEKCDVFASSGSKDLDFATCHILLTRARFSPATGDGGKTIYGLYRTMIGWSLHRGRRDTLGPDLELTVNEAPAGVKLPMEISVSYRIGTTGHISHCDAGDKTPDAPRTLIELACQSLAGPPLRIIYNKRGEPVEAVDTARVSFAVHK